MKKLKVLKLEKRTKSCASKSCSPKRSLLLSWSFSFHIRSKTSTVHRCAREVLPLLPQQTSTMKIRKERRSDGKGATYSNHLNNFNLHTHSHRYQCFENRLFSPKKQLCSVFFFLSPPFSAQAGPPTFLFHHGSSKG